MCGLAGVARRGEPRSVGSPLAAIAHRGPDDSGHKAITGDGWACDLFHTRLSIVDLSPAGKQPITNEDGALQMIFNGEIYNSVELRRYCEAKGHTFSSSMDGEVILHLWEMEGCRALTRLNGIFAVVILDTERGELTLARDPLGVKPLFYSVGKDNELWFASELSALRATGAPLGRRDPLALAQFLSFLWIPDPRTPYADARTIQPGHKLTWTRRGVSYAPYGEMLEPTAETLDLSPVEALREAEDRFSAAAERQLMADVPIGLMASGGVDSGLIWWATKDHLAQGYTIEWEKDSGAEQLSEDVDAVTVLERRFGTEIQYLNGEAAEDHPIPRSGDLFADPAYQLTRLIARTAHQQGCKVLLSGQGGDELFAGYRRHSIAPLISRLKLGGLGATADKIVRQIAPGDLRAEYAARVFRAASEPNPFDRYMQLCTYSTAQERARILDCTEAEVSNEAVWQQHREVFDSLAEGVSFLRKAMAVDLRVYLPGLGLAYVDRAGMEFGVEIRVPWLDLELVRWSLTLPDRLLLKRLRGKWLTRELAARKLGSDIGHRSKRGFAAPSARVAIGSASRGQQSFRQGDYLARAEDILKDFLGAPRVPAA